MLSTETAAYSVFPNPASDQLTVGLPRSVPVGQVQLINLLGAVVMTRRLGAQGATIDVSALPAQTYVLRVLDAQGVVLGSQRVVVLQRK